MKPDHTKEFILDMLDNLSGLARRFGLFKVEVEIVACMERISALRPPYAVPPEDDCREDRSWKRR